MGLSLVIFFDISPSSPARSLPDASPKGIHQEIHGIRGQISVRSASSDLIFNFPGFFSSDNGSVHGSDLSSSHEIKAGW